MQLGETLYLIQYVQADNMFQMEMAEKQVSRFFLLAIIINFMNTIPCVENHMAFICFDQNTSLEEWGQVLFLDIP